MQSKTGIAVSNSRTANFQTSPSECHFPLGAKDIVMSHPFLLYSLATGTDYVRGKLAAHANELLSLGTDGFRIDAAKRENRSFWPLFHGVNNRVPVSDVPVTDIQAIFSKLSSKPIYVTQEVRTPPITGFTPSLLIVIRFTTVELEKSLRENTSESVKLRRSNTPSHLSPRLKRTESPLSRTQNPWDTPPARAALPILSSPITIRNVTSQL